MRERAAHNLDMIIEVAGSKGCERLLSDGLLDKIVSLLRDNSVSVRTAGYQVLINACARSPQIQRDLCAMDGMIEYLLTETESEKHAHAARALCLIQYCLTSEDQKLRCVDEDNVSGNHTRSKLSKILFLLPVGYSLSRNSNGSIFCSATTAREGAAS